MNLAVQSKLLAWLRPAAPGLHPWGTGLQAAASYYIASALGLLVAVPPARVLAWPASGLLFAFLVLSPRRAWPSILGGTLAAHALAHAQAGAALATAAGAWAGAAASALLGALLLRERAPEASFASVPAVLALACAALAASMLGTPAEFVVGGLLGSGGASLDLWASRVLSTTLAAVVFLPLLACGRSEGTRRPDPFSMPQRSEARILLAAVLAASVLLASDTPAATRVEELVAFLLLPLLFWAALRFGLAGCSAGLAVAVSAAAVDRGAGGGHAASLAVPAIALLPAQLLLLAASIGLLLIAALVEERRAAERHLTHLARVSSLAGFSGAIAHELNQPLAAILSNAHAAARLLACEPPPVAELRSIVQDIVDADRRAGDLIRHLRLLVRDGDPEWAELDLNALVAATLSLVQANLLRHEIAWRTRYAQNLPPVRGDAVYLQQLLLNLLSNASEAMQRSSRRQRVLGIATALAPGGEIHLVVSDTGPGIPRERLDRVFEPFYTHKEGGLGLGLAICRRIALLHRGVLTVSSRPGAGATFRLALPASPAAKAPAEPQGRAAAQGTDDALHRIG